jgi:single-stranded DNA-binding protein
MNHLNSVLIEGRLVMAEDPGVAPDGTPYRRFTIANDRFYKADGGMTKEVSRFVVYAGGKLAEGVIKTARNGQGVRIVGRLKQPWQSPGDSAISGVFIIAEHIELRPENQDAAEKADAANAADAVNTDGETAA